MKKLIVQALTIITFFASINGSFVFATELSQPEMIGLSKQDLLKCAGVPIGQESIDNLEFLTFADREASSNVESGKSDNTNSGIVVVNSLKNLQCGATTFVLKDGLIQHVYSPGRSERIDADAKKCNYIFEKCKLDNQIGK